MSIKCTYVLRVSASFLGHSHTVSIKPLITVLQHYASVLTSRMQSIEHLDQIQTTKQCQSPEDEKEIIQKHYSHLCFPKCTRMLQSLKVFTFRPLFLLLLVVLTLFRKCFVPIFIMILHSRATRNLHSIGLYIKFSLHLSGKAGCCLQQDRWVYAVQESNNYLLSVTMNAYIYCLDKTDSLYC